MSIGSDAYQLAFQCSPIFLVNGIAKNIPGGVLPIIVLTEAASFVTGLLTGADTPDSLDDFFAHFQPIPGAEIVSQQLGKYPFANQGVAANATIAQPLNFSMFMVCPAKKTLGYVAKLATMIALRETLTQHNSLGGTYVVLMPSAIYLNAILLTMAEVGGGQSKQPQIAWQLNFEAPLLTLESAQSAQNSLMSKLTTGSAIDGDPTWSGLNVSTTNPNVAQMPGVIPSGGGTLGGIQAPLIGPGHPF